MLLLLFLQVRGCVRALSVSLSTSSSESNGWNLGRLNHVAIAVPDLDRAATLYRDVLGAKVSEVVVSILQCVFTANYVLCHFMSLQPLLMNKYLNSPRGHNYGLLPLQDKIKAGLIPPPPIRHNYGLLPLQDKIKAGLIPPNGHNYCSSIGYIWLPYPCGHCIKCPSGHDNHV